MWKTINGIDYFRNSPLVQKAVSDLIWLCRIWKVTQAAPPLAELGIDQKPWEMRQNCCRFSLHRNRLIDINGEEYLAIPALRERT